MLLSHDSKRPHIDDSAYIAPNATICGDVRIAAGCRIMFGACIVAEGAPVTLGDNCIVMEHAVIRSTDEHATTIGRHCLIGPHAHLAGCSLDDCVFIATGASVFHGARLGYNAEVRVNAVVHLRTEPPPVVLPPEQHDAIWAVQKLLDFPKYVYGVERAADGESSMPAITRRRSASLGRHRSDEPL